jgi:hypothetical protein
MMESWKIKCAKCSAKIKALTDMASPEFWVEAKKN